MLRRGLGWIAWACATALVVGPALALVPASLLDRGPDGSVRLAWIGPALVIGDPFVRDCVQRSLVAAVLVATGSGTIGVALGRVVGRWRFWGRRPLAALAWASMAATPPLAAIGLRSLLEWPGFGSSGDPEWVRWLAWAWSGLAGGIPTVALVTLAGLERVERAWEEAARAAGASRRQVWRAIAWPLIRPSVARAVASIFALMLLEPGAPMVLGLRRTLAFQVVEAALAGPDSVPRAAALAGLGAIAAGLGGILLRWWGRTPGPALPPAAEPIARRARWPKAATFLLFLTGWSTLALLPTFGLLRIAATPGHALLRHLRGDLDAYRLLGRSLIVGLVAGGIGLVLAWARGRPEESSRRPRWARADRAIRSLPAAFPPLAVAVGALMVPRLLAMLADVLPSGRSAVANALRSLAERLDPFGSPGVLLVLALVAVQIPTLARAVDGRRPIPHRLGESARSLGASRWRIGRARLRLWLGSAPGAALALSIALASTALVPGLILSPILESRTLGPIVLDLADTPGGLERAAALGVVGWGMNLAAFAFASRRRAGAVGDWFRG